jgi:hypothetical protein
MSALSEINVTADQGVVSLTGVSDEKQWHASLIGDGKILLEAAPESGGIQNSSFAKCDIEMFAATIRGLFDQKFSGTVVVHFSAFAKKIFIQKGELVFASSSLMDDRLGEVIYRRGLITIDQMMAAAVQVNRSKKFGKVLIESEGFSNIGLWNALKLQVLEIFNSIFFYDEVFFQVNKGDSNAPTSVYFEEDSKYLLDEANQFGEMFREFKSRMNAQSVASFLPGGKAKSQGADYKGTFLGDFSGMIERTPKVQELTNDSKLNVVTTTLALFDLMNRKWVVIDGMDKVRAEVGAAAEVREVKSYLDSYHVFLGLSQKLFKDSDKHFPVSELHAFVRPKYPVSRIPLYLSEDGAIAPGSAQSLFSMLRVGAKEKVISHVLGLSQFLLQVSCDMLPEKGGDLKQSYREMFDL